MFQIFSRKNRTVQGSRTGQRQRRSAWRSILELEMLEDRLVLSPYTLTNGTGDGSVTMGIDGFGSFARFSNSNATDAFYNPIGPGNKAGTVGDSAIAIRVGTSGPRTYLSSGRVANAYSGLMTNPTITGTATDCTSTFTWNGFSFTLVQNLSYMYDNDGVLAGSVLTQTYTITNTKITAVDFEVVRYLDGDLQFDGSQNDGGGRLNGTPETLFETDSGGGGTTSTTFLGTTAVGGTVPTTNHYQINYWSTLAASIANGSALTDTVYQDNNADNFVDAGKETDIALASRNLYHLDPGGSADYTTQTIFGSGTPNSLVLGVRVTPTGGSTVVTEGGATDTYSVYLRSQPLADVIITPNPGSQLTVSPATLTFNASNWYIPQTVTVTAVDDFVYEGTRSVNITHSATSGDPGYQGISVNSVPVTINDNDPQAGVTIQESGGSTAVTEGGATDSYTAVLNSQPTAPVTVTINLVAATPSANLNISATTLTFAPAVWNVPQTVTVSAEHDNFTELTNPYTRLITHTDSSADPNFNNNPIASVTVRITDIDVPGVTIVESGGSTAVTEGGTSDNYTVVLNSKPTDIVTVALNPGSHLTVSPAVLTFTPTNWDALQTVTVKAIWDNIAEASSPYLCPISHTATSPDGHYNGIAIATVNVSVTDIDVPGVLITQSSGSTLVLAGGTGDSYTVELKTKPADDVTIAVNPGSQLTTTPASLVFTPADWNVPQTVTVEAGIVSGYGIDSVTHAASSSDPVYNGITIANVPVTILDKTGYIVTGTPGNDTITVTPSADHSQMLVSVNGQTTFVPATVTQLVINAGNGNDTIQLYNPIVPVFVDANLGTDTLVIYGQAGVNTFVLDNLTLTANGNVVTTYGLENLVVNGFAGNDSFTVTANPDPSLKNIAFNGGLGSDGLTGSASENSWKITACNTGLLNGVIKFFGIENLTGNSTLDTFSFSPGKNVTGRIDGAGGNDVLDYSLFTTPLTFNLQTGTATATGGIQNIETILGGKSTYDKLVGPDGNSTWNITGKNACNVSAVYFQNIENLLGGSGNDTFTFADGASLTGKLDGGAGTGDTLNYSAYTTPLYVNLQLKKATAITGGIAGIEGITGGSAANTLNGANLASTWTLTGTNAGQITNVSGNFTFTGFGNLIGGASVDTFNATGSWTGKLDGGLGLDTVTGNNSNHTWNIMAQNGGTLDGRPFANIENLKGGNGVDTFTFAAGKAITGKIDGGTGSDILDYSAFTTAVSVNLATGKATGVAGLLNLEQFRAGSNLNNFLIAANLSNTWNLTGTNVGNLTNSSGPFSFTGFQNLTGGTLDDAFTLAVADGWSGFLQGGLGIDTLTPFGTGNTWTTSSLNGHKFGSIEIIM